MIEQRGREKNSRNRPEKEKKEDQREWKKQMNKQRFRVMKANVSANVSARSTNFESLERSKFFVRFDAQFDRVDREQNREN